MSLVNHPLYQPERSRGEKLGNSVLARRQGRQWNLIAKKAGRERRVNCRGRQSIVVDAFHFPSFLTFGRSSGSIRLVRFAAGSFPLVRSRCSQPLKTFIFLLFLFLPFSWSDRVSDGYDIPRVERVPRRESRISDNRVLRAHRSPQTERKKEDRLLSVLFQSFVRFSTPTASQPLDFAGETRPGVIAIKHRKLAKLRCNLAGDVLPPYLHFESRSRFTCTRQRACVTSCRVYVYVSTCSSLSVVVETPVAPFVRVCSSVCLFAQVWVHVCPCLRAWGVHGRRRKVLRDIAAAIRPSFRELNFAGSRATFAPHLFLSRPFLVRLFSHDSDLDRHSASQAAFVPSTAVSLSTTSSLIWSGPCFTRNR